MLFGLGAAIYAAIHWYRLDFGAITGDALIKTVTAASFLTVLGFQVIFSSFFVCVLEQVPDRPDAKAEARRESAELAMEG